MKARTLFSHVPSLFLSIARKSLCITTISMLAIFCCSAVLLACPVYNPSTGHWYTIVSSGNDGSWGNAENNAIALNGHLVTINDSAEETWLRDIFGGTTKFWIGFNDAEIEGNWVWSSDEAVTYTNWAPGEPNNCTPPPIGEDYAVLNWGSNGAWNDWDHQRPDYYHIDGIAEYTPVPVPSTCLLFLLSILGMAGMKRKVWKA
ncbi:MAG: C-type lectin domain-containing protein [bacterium]